MTPLDVVCAAESISEGQRAVERMIAFTSRFPLPSLSLVSSGVLSSYYIPLFYYRWTVFFPPICELSSLTGFGYPKISGF